MKKSLSIFLLLIFIVITAAFSIRAQATPQTYDEFVDAGKEAAGSGDYNAAAKWYTKAIGVRNTDDDSDLLYARAGCLAVQKKYGEAVQDLNVILDAHSDNAKALYARASYLNADGDYKKAIKDAEALMKLEPGNAGAYQARGGSYLGLKKYKESEADLTRSIELDPDNAITYTLRAAVYQMTGKAGPAEADRLKAEQLQQKP
jgi:tetratricopeptide (TPR) repeat protein